jgi:hypothetical protein
VMGAADHMHVALHPGPSLAAHSLEIHACSMGGLSGNICNHPTCAAGDGHEKRCTREPLGSAVTRAVPSALAATPLGYLGMGVGWERPCAQAWGLRAQHLERV